MDLKKGPLIQADETRVPVLQQEGKGRNDTAWMWQYSAPGGLIYFDYQDSRSRDGPKNFLAGYQGTLQSDGYEVYTKPGQEVHAHAGCWVHARRKFDNARKAAPREVPCRDSQDIFDQIAVLYQIEQEARSAGPDAAARLHHRNQRGLFAKLDALKQSILSIRSRVLPASQLGKACDYTLGQWEKLIVHARDGVVEMTTTGAKTACVPSPSDAGRRGEDMAVGRANGLDGFRWDAGALNS